MVRFRCSNNTADELGESCAKDDEAMTWNVMKPVSYTLFFRFTLAVAEPRRGVGLPAVSERYALQYVDVYVTKITIEIQIQRSLWG
jgi:hypothetical protein